MGAVEDRLVCELHEVREYLGIEDGSDDILNLILTASKQAADLYLNNVFEDSDGLELDIPELVKLGVLRWIEEEDERRGVGLTSERAGDLARSYGALSWVEHPAALRCWQRYRILPGL